MQVSELMQRGVRTIDEDSTLGLALQVMRWQDIRHLPVLRDGKLVGILSERDLLRCQLDGAPGLQGKVRDAMRSPVDHIHPRANAADAAADMATKRIGCLPVVDAGEVVGILTTTDLLGQMAQLPVPTPPAPAEESKAPSVTELMTPEPLTAKPDDSLVDAAAKMAARGIRHLCVVDADLQVLGMLTDRHIRTQIGNPLHAASTAESSRRLTSLRVADAMTQDVRVVATDSSTADLIHALISDRMDAVPVVDGHGTLRGIVSYVDVLQAVAAGV